MARWDNFTIWRGRLPHWRADNVTYFVTFRHRRSLALNERHLLLNELRKSDDRKLEIDVANVTNDTTSLLFRVLQAPNEQPYELSDVIERAKTRAAKQITKKTAEIRPPFYSESFDRIVRDEVEYEELWQGMVSAADEEADAERWPEPPTLYVRNAPSQAE